MSFINYITRLYLLAFSVRTMIKCLLDTSILREKNIEHLHYSTGEKHRRKSHLLTILEAKLLFNTDEIVRPCEGHMELYRLASHFKQSIRTKSKLNLILYLTGHFLKAKSRLLDEMLLQRCIPRLNC